VIRNYLSSGSPGSSPVDVIVLYIFFVFFCVHDLMTENRTVLTDNCSADLRVKEQISKLRQVKGCEDSALPVLVMLACARWLLPPCSHDMHALSDFSCRNLTYFCKGFARGSTF
jgi:hypothetical protein